MEDFAAAAPERALGPSLLAAAMLLLALDLLISLGLRGLLRPSRGRRWYCCSPLLIAPAAHALDTNTNPALATRLGYIATGDAQVDGVSRAGLEGLSDYVNRRTAATLVEPDAVEPGKTDLSFYPLLYWPITADAQPLASDAERGAERLHEPRRHHPDRHARFRLRRAASRPAPSRHCSGLAAGW